MDKVLFSGTTVVSDLISYSELWDFEILGEDGPPTYGDKRVLVIYNKHASFSFPYKARHYQAKIKCTYLDKLRGSSYEVGCLFSTFKRDHRAYINFDDDAQHGLSGNSYRLDMSLRFATMDYPDGGIRLLDEWVVSEKVKKHV